MKVTEFGTNPPNPPGIPNLSNPPAPPDLLNPPNSPVLPDLPNLSNPPDLLNPPNSPVLPDLSNPLKARLIPICHGVILAGGRSSRMGRDKALLPVGGRPLLARLIGELREAVTGEIVVAVSSPEREAAYRSLLGPLPGGVAFVLDRQQDAGPVAGLAAGLAALPDGYAYATACDTPELSRQWLVRLLHEAMANGAPAVAAQGEPLHALYHTGLAQLAERALADGDYRLMSLLRRAGAVELTLTEQEKAAYGLYNLNTPEQYETYLANKPHKIEG
ncbi:molybdenum cofactor guanylyltransferase [Paenibacillus agaridevorans]|uniref:molybdenum cofactor guanylyltransferase n=1 Tax=Paenibacillus agaridevorans TaxID=171404 RepID=UPI002484B8EA|nr:molybdenum cofactor guanylyltransferase [Paenibacillus agaridevorans]